MYSHAISKSASSLVVGSGVYTKEVCVDGIVVGPGEGGIVGSDVGGGVRSREGPPV